MARGNVDCRPSLGPFATLGHPIYPRHPYLPKGVKGQGAMLNHRVGRPGFSEPRETSSSATASYSISVPVFGMTTPVLSVGEERGGFTGIFEIVAADKARVGRVKRRPLCEPYLTLAPLLPDLPRHPAGPRGERAREPWSTTRSSLTIPNLITRVVRSDATLLAECCR